jgi:NADPH-dependent curcumin reductase CurA
VKPGSSIPGFGIAKLIKINRTPKKKTFMEVGDWVIGMLEWSEYVLLDYKTIQKLPVVFQTTFRIFKSKAINF